MSIKKGLAVIDSNGSVTHKLLDDGSVNIGKTGAQFDLKGRVYLGANAAGKRIDNLTDSNGVAYPEVDVVSVAYYNSLDVYNNAYVAMISYENAQYPYVGQRVAQHNATYINSNGAGTAKMEIFDAAINAESSAYATYRNTTLPGDIAAAYVTSQNLRDAQAARITSEEAAELAAEQAHTLASDNTHNTLTAFETVNGAATDVTTFQEIVDFINTKDTENDTSLLNAFNSLNTAITNEEAARAAADTSLRTKLAGEVVDRNTAIAGALGDRATTEAYITSNWSDNDDYRVSIIGAITASQDAGDAAVSTAVSSAVSARVAGDEAIEVQISGMESGETGAAGSFSLRLDEEEQNRAEDYASLSTVISTMDSTQASIRTVLTSRLADQVSKRTTDIAARDADLTAQAADFEAHVSSSHSALSAQLSTAVADRQAADASLIAAVNGEKADADTGHNGLSGSIAAEASARDSVHTSLRADITAMSQSLDAIINTPADLDEFSEIVNYINAEMGTTNSDNRDALASAVASLNVLIAAEQQAQDDGDASLRADMDAEISAMDSAMTSFASRQGTYVNTTIPALSSSVKGDYDADNIAMDNYITVNQNQMLANISGEETARANGDTAIQNAIDAEVKAQGEAYSAEAAARAAADTNIQDQIDAFVATGFSGQQISVTGDTSLGSLTLAADGEFQVGTVTDPTAFASGDQSGNNGMMFYLDMPSFSASGPFVSNKKWYFCENGIWHMSPFYKE
jgi:hypothetical protein